MAIAATPLAVPGPMARALGLAFAVLALVEGVLIWPWLAAFLCSPPVASEVLFQPTVDVGPARDLTASVLIDCLLISLFGLQHSAMARPAVKQFLLRFLPQELERALFVHCAVLALALIMMFWQPIPIVVWHVADGGPAFAAIWAVFALGWAILLGGAFAFDLLELMGFNQAWAWASLKPFQPLELKSPWLYEQVRHPMYLGLLLIFWATSRMTVGHLLLAAGLTTYMLVGITFEERALERKFGAPYRAYRARVPMLIPRLKALMAR